MVSGNPPKLYVFILIVSCGRIFSGRLQLNMLLGLTQIEIMVCDCKPAALQVLRKGLFPCAPERPSLAVDLTLLEFVRGLFTRTSPNITAWCNTLEASLGGRFYKLDTKVCA